MSKYILMPDGGIKKKTGNDYEDVNAGGDVNTDSTVNILDIGIFGEDKQTKDVKDVSEEKLSEQRNFFGVSPDDGSNVSITRKFDDVLIDRDLIIHKSGSFLKDDSFGFEGDSSNRKIPYYINFNVGLSENDSARVFAEEMHMIAGFDLNDQRARGIYFSGVVFDYLLESISFIGAAIGIASGNFLFNTVEDDVGNDKFVKRLLPLKKHKFTTPLFDYFDKILNFNFTEEQEAGIVLAEAIVNTVYYYLIGFETYISSDPATKITKKTFSTLEYMMPGKKDENLGESALRQAANIGRVAVNIFSGLLSQTGKITENRVYLLIRKFQQKRYWHQEILYKAKEMSDENSYDKSLVEFNNYYFKFINERIKVGKAYYRGVRKRFEIKNKIENKKGHKGTLRIGEFSLGAERTESGTSFKQYNTDVTDAGLNQESVPEEAYYRVGKQTSTTSILSLESLIKRPHIKGKNSKDNSASFIDEFYKEKFVNVGDGEVKRFSIDKVKVIEAKLDREYVPFYFHDIRTNEIISFHAFIDSISDSFNPEYSPVSGFGRIDDVRHYIKTTRNVGFSFSLVSFNEEDHDMMWYQINKLTSMVYPQWSKGLEIKGNEAKNKKDGSQIEFPFTQVPTASPLIRIRLGDIIKTNYSSRSFAKIFGANELDSDILSENTENGLNNPFKKAYESSMSKGLAGFITSLSLDYGDSPWHISDVNDERNVNDNKVAPIFVKVTANFSPVHDIAPGLDHRGDMRAPTHNTGRIVSKLFPYTPYEDKVISDVIKKDKNSRNVLF